MKKKKGFTLIEMIGVITVLAVITLVTAPTIINMLKKSDEEKYNQILKDLFLATENYIQSNADEYIELKSVGGTVSISIGQLRNEKLVKKTLINPKTNQNFADTDGVKVTVKADKTYDFAFINNVPVPTPKPDFLGGAAYIVSKNPMGLHDDTLATGLDANRPYSSRKHFSGEEVSNYLVFENLCWSIINIAQNSSIKIVYEGPTQNNVCTGVRTAESGSIYISGVYGWNTQNRNSWYAAETILRTTFENFRTNPPSSFPITASAFDKLQTATYYVGAVGVKSGQTLAEDIRQERTNQGKSNLPTLASLGKTEYTYEGVFALPNISDFVKASSSSMCTSAYEASGNGKCWAANYMSKSYFGYTLNPSGENAFDVWALNTYGPVNSNGVDLGWGARPTAYLKPSVTITGSGTAADPFKVS